MKFLLFISTYILLYVMSIYKCTVYSSGCPCQSTFSLEDVIPNYALRGHVISTTEVADVGQCFHMCVYSNTACKSFNICKRQNKGMLCELNEKRKDFDPHALQASPGWNHYELNWRLLSQPYYFKDCNCRHYIEFTCECQEGYLGNQCDMMARSCQDYLRFKGTYQSGFYVVFDGNDTMFSVYCDMDIMNLSAWTLVLSYALQYNKEFNSTPFFVNNPLNEDTPNWHLYRLSLARMYSIRASSNYWRASCNYSSYGIDQRDYAVAKWTDIDLLSFNGNGCHRFAYINIRGSYCFNCTTWVHQGLRRSRMFLVAARYGQNEGCGLIAANGSELYEESFGYYTGISRQFRCTTADDSTTQFWFGGTI